MTINQNFSQLAMAGALAVAPMLSGCATTSLLPQSRHVNEISGNNCVITKADSFKRGIILSILLPFVPDHSKSDTTKIDDGCRDRQVAQAAFQKTDKDSRIIAVTIYDQLSPSEKAIMNRQFESMGTSIEELAADLPRITGTIVDKENKCVTVNYRLPTENTAPFLIRCANGPSIS